MGMTLDLTCVLVSSVNRSATSSDSGVSLVLVWMEREAVPVLSVHSDRSSKVEMTLGD